MFHFQTLDCYRHAITFLPLAYSLAKLGDGELGTQLRRASLSIALNIAEGTGRFGKDERKFLITARGSAFECAAALDALSALDVRDARIRAGHELLVRVVSTLTKMINKHTPKSPTPTPTPTPTPDPRT